MNNILLYHIWRKDSSSKVKGTKRYAYEYSTSSLEEAQKICSDSSGAYVYTWQDSYFGEAG